MDDNRLIRVAAYTGLWYRYSEERSTLTVGSTAGAMSFKYTKNKSEPSRQRRGDTQVRRVRVINFNRIKFYLWGNPSVQHISSRATPTCCSLWTMTRKRTPSSTFEKFHTLSRSSPVPYPARYIRKSHQLGKRRYLKGLHYFCFVRFVPKNLPKADCNSGGWQKCAQAAYTNVLFNKAIRFVSCLFLHLHTRVVPLWHLTRFWKGTSARKTR